MFLGALDIALLAISFGASAAIGLYHGIKGLNQTSTDYLLGGRRMGALPLAMSLTVGTVSAITIMGNAGEMYAHGTQLWVMDVGMALGMYFVAKFFIPIFYPLKMISLYHVSLGEYWFKCLFLLFELINRRYIQCRFKSTWLRKSTVILTLSGAYLFIGFLLFPPSLFLKTFTGLSITANIVITGLACSLYSSFGGVKAVVYTDVLQALIMIVGSLAMVIQGAHNVGGLDKAWDIAYHHGRIEFFKLSSFNLDPYQRHSFWLVIVYGFFFSMSTYGVNQSQTQRTFSTSSVKEAQKVIYYAIVGMFLLKGLVNLSGIVMFANFKDCDPLTKDGGPPHNNVLIVVSYVLMHLTKIPGLAGLFVASIYAAVLR
ncbi:UNVERIFIED_CONTAM: hypothetical protein GTU68_067184 [Idotea baltica]|nr:hypothetical protein [Idotea baltica]